MNLLLKQCNGAFIERISVSEDATVKDLKQLFYEKFHFYPQRQQWNLGSADGPRIVEGTLKQCGVLEDSSLYFKDLGVQISWRLVFFLEYIGPLMILPVLYHFPWIFYGSHVAPKSNVQFWTYCMLMFHFMKREVESIFVHRFSKTTMPIINLFTNCFHYWVLCACGIGYYVFHPRYTEIRLFCRHEKVLLVLMFFFFQFMTFMTHITLRNLRPKATKVRGIPQNWGFQYVSCANYFWELLIWVVVALFTNTVPAYFFTFAVATILCNWAKKKHQRYIKEFPHYDKTKKAIIPFVY
ncbi:3-oxo-5-alpha-steroid 4-dehydrogenase family protein, putative [Babesia bigemina]|uniref:3-oxo-5-alpha-steroid 4-dehydrogenase family protein, putative n=1 Tax=Babesia bigemina TaxID=5866 RepID=A0A061D6V1_BABBI|nr:3-oxo-5-alpha-steroid 4-dehydrogenase family protein, putative [Babesia bigemina]CDR96426.1 3-oxo-5-alpha-steroid 4-dehydrogenase family protein, putative [Babesia bigemina]|eukprot:XP_012768612.1 3-oxo-5-alpha-steroid 4-dehydrogenase family protein, putative [Babesia bigemina]